MTQELRTERRTRRSQRIRMAWWMSGLAVLVACGGSGSTPATTPMTTARAPSPTRSVTPQPTAADTIPCLPADIVRHLHELLGEPNAAVHRRTCGR